MEYELALEMIEQYRQENMELRELLTELHEWNLRMSVAWLDGNERAGAGGIPAGYLSKIIKYTYLELCNNCDSYLLDGNCPWCNRQPKEPDPVKHERMCPDCNIPMRFIVSQDVNRGLLYTESFWECDECDLELRD